MDENSERRNLGRLGVAAAIISLIAAALQLLQVIIQFFNN